MVSASARWFDQVRRESSQGIPGYLSDRLRHRASARTHRRADRDGDVLGRAWRENLSRRQPPHQTRAVLGMADQHGAGAQSRGDFSVGGVYAAQNDADAGESRFLSIVYLFYLAEQKVRNYRVFD